MEELELIWVPKKIAKQYKESDSDKEKFNIIEKILNNKKTDIKDMISCLDDDLLMFKAFATKYKIEFEKVAKEQEEQMDAVFQNYTTVYGAISAKVEEVVRRLNPISEQIKDINKCLENVSTYKLETMFKLIENFSRMSTEEKEMLKLLLNK